MIMEEQKLDNPVWFSCLETHSEFAIGLDGLQSYHPDYCSFTGFDVLDKTAQSLNDYAKLSSSFFVVGARPQFDQQLLLTRELICDQMILKEPIALPITEDIVELQELNAESLFFLVNLVQPGYFKNDTPKLGQYFGIFKDGNLVAVTGERMKMNCFTEISAVITHPNYNGKGYAKQLVTHVANTIFAQGKTPYLHVAENNLGAINLYKKLGFEYRRKISFWNFEKVPIAPHIQAV